MTAPSGSFAPRPLRIEARGVGFRYATAGTPALHDLAFELPAGGSLLVVGPSGSGKSTLARALAGLLPGDLPGEPTGSLLVGDASAWGRPAGETGILFQDPGSQIVMDRVADDVAFGLENRAWPVDAMRTRVPEALDVVGLPGFEERRTGTLSGGEQQRVALAGVLAPGPGLLVLDEPTANLDPDGAAAVFDDLERLRASGAVTIVLVEHHVDRAWPLADLVLALDAAGGPVDFGSPESVLERSAGRMREAGIWLPGDEDRGRPGAGVRPAAEGPAGPGLVARVSGLGFAYRDGLEVLHDVSLELHPGERVALTGPNGSGKSTLGRLLAGLARPSRGEVRLRGRDPGRLGPRDLARLVGHAPQDPELAFLAETVAEDAALGLDRAELERLPAVMERLGLPLAGFGARSPYRLSGGEQRRLSLVPAIMRRPALMVLDEPTFGLDRRAHDELVAILAELSGAGTAVVVATHDERLVRRFATRRLRLEGGRLGKAGAA